MAEAQQVPEWPVHQPKIGIVLFVVFVFLFTAHALREQQELELARANAAIRSGALACRCDAMLPT